MGQIVYGYQLNKDIPIEIENLLISHFKNLTPGFLKFPSIKEDTKANAFGIVLDTFDKNDDVDITRLNFKASNQQKEDMENLLQVIEPQLQEYFKSQEAKEFILWTESKPDNNAIMRELSTALYHYAYLYEEWNDTGSPEAEEDQAYCEGVLDSLQRKYNISSFTYTLEGFRANAAGENAYKRATDNKHEQYDPNYTQEDGLRDLLRQL